MYGGLDTMISKRSDGISFKKSRLSDNGLQSNEKSDLKDNNKSQETIQDDKEKFDKVQS